jgi:hypothetical protein
MNPSVDDRLASIVRALTYIVLPALPDDAGLAKEQTQLAIGHLQILRAQLDAAPGFEAEELSDARALGAALLVGGKGGAGTDAALHALRAALEQPVGAEHPRQSRLRIAKATEELQRKTALDGDPGYRASSSEVLLRLQTERATKDRKWFALMGFDTDI